MALTAVVKDGKIVDTGSINKKEASKNATSVDNTADKNMFLNLLVAEMKYQDPMEPTSNTEWVSQYATFAGIEKQNAVVLSTKQMEAQQLVGKEVIMRQNDEKTGETNFFSGKVDYMYVEGEKIFLSIENKLYNLDDLDTVVDKTYMDAVTEAKEFTEMVDLIVANGDLSSRDETLLKQARAKYDSMDDYQKSFVDKDVYDKFKKLEDRYIKKPEASEGSDKANGKGGEEKADNDKADKSDKPNDTEGDK